nr:MAG TPA: hypothetical protein [Caudoviricetes sp.]
MFYIWVAHFWLTIFIYREPAVCPIFGALRAVGSQSRHFCPYIGLKSFLFFKNFFHNLYIKE